MCKAGNNLQRSLEVIDGDIEGGIFFIPKRIIFLIYKNILNRGKTENICSHLGKPELKHRTVLLCQNQFFFSRMTADHINLKANK